MDNGLDHICTNWKKTLPLTRSLDKLFEEANLCGELKLGSRKLKFFPTSSNYDVSDIIVADLSRNNFTILPTEIFKFWSLEFLSLHDNIIRSIPNTISTLQSLVYLDLSRNFLISLPPTLFQLPLETLLLSKNKLKQIPAEIGFCKSLLELDISFNKLTHLPPQLGQLPILKSLNAQNNLLIELPLELTYLKLVKLIFSHNRIASLPIELRLMTSLEKLDVAENPLVSPPCAVCSKGRIFIFKWLEMKSIKEGRGRAMSSWKFNSVKNSHHSLDSNMDSLNMSEPASLVHSSDEGANGSLEHINKVDKKNGETNGYNYNASPEFLRTSKSNGSTPTYLKKFTNGSSNNDNFDVIKQNEKPTMHTQSYKEYKEFLKQQRTQDSIYKGKVQKNDLGNVNKKISNIQDIRPYIKPTAPEIKPISSNNIIAPVPSYHPPMKVWSNDNTIQVTKSKLQFTMKREYEKAKEEAELVKQLRNTIESRLKMSLPSELAPALSDGVVLCYLANHVKPRSVASIHVPSPAVPKLTMARCRRNVDNFLEACRKIGVNDKLICCAVDILEGKGIVQIAITVAELLKFYTPKSPSQTHHIQTMM
ncbi:leucine-rich repeat and calponin homology domain-containing protein isoform X2 [Daktulosphaira vitifoliae]|uniref:leucine-rich repeat and calponin homology domain-containing protein isoform X2 n=1 Tax=Daktulosphaira vitifoliae TaxID=58002 RepID=UPI0021A97B4C|nr:leucine-rich repeat and calponin homology domain-containing protein isoform X2 [Daktulosphaira vitifoliae]